MSYFLYAILSKSQLQLRDELNSVKSVNLGQGLFMIPLTDSLVDEITGLATGGNEVVHGFERLSTTLDGWLKEISTHTSVAYVEAEFWGGVGAQSAVMWHEREVVFEALHTQDAINQILRRLGIEPGDKIDEFAAVELGRKRFIDEW
jgi:hypothetical protein